jgi:CRISPR/Cas system CSM-associated protein Csm2 small subunit
LVKNMTSKFEEALQTCLDLILGGNETIETALAQFPEWSEDLKPQLEAALWLTTYREVLDPRPGFVSASRRRLVERLKEERQQAPLTWRERMQQLIPVQRVAPVAFVFIMMLVLFVGGSLVSESKNALPGDRLYSLKLTLEGLALATSINQVNEAELQVRHVKARLEEIRALIVEGSFEEAAQTASDLETQVQETKNLLDEVADQDPYQAFTLYQELALILERQQPLLNYLNGSSTPDYRSIYNSLSKVLVKAEDIDDKLKNIRVSITGATPTYAPPTPFPSPTATRIIRNTPTPAPTRKPDEPTPTPKPTQPPPTNTPVPTQKPTNTPEPTSTNTPEPTSTNTPQPTSTNTPEPTSTNTPEPTSTNTPEPTSTNTPEPTSTPVPPDTPTSVAPSGPTPTPINSPPPTPTI